MPSGPEPHKQEHVPGTCTCADCTRVVRDLGSLTGWLLAGPSAPAPDNQDDFLECCPNCGLQLQPQRPGSLTQWIFKYQLCKCQAGGGKAAWTEIAGPDLLPVDSEIEVDEDFPSKRFAPLKITAQGVNGTIYESIDRVLFKTVAVKTLRSMDSRQYVAFQNEARAISMLDHPGIVRVLDFSLSEGGAPFMVMEFVGGESLDAYLRKHGLLREEQALDVFIRIAEAIGHAHSKGVLHRDLKPENVLVEVLDSGDLDVKVVDFGLARIARETLVSTGSGDWLMVGTPVYMSPDTMLGLDYDERSDIYSLGSLMFELLSGKPPFEAEGPLELMSRKSREDPPTLRQAGAVVRDEIEKIVAKALDRDVSKRYQSMMELLIDLKTAKAGSAGGESPHEPDQAVPSPANPVQAKTIPPQLVFGTAGLLFIGFLVWFATTYTRLDEMPELDKTARAPLADAQLDAMAPGLDPVGHFYRSQYRQYTTYTNPDPKFKSAHLEDLRDCTDIDGVSVTDCPVTLSDMRFLAKQNLKVLAISKCRISDQALAVIAAMPSLVELNLCLVKLNRRPVDFLGKLKELRVLNIADTGIEADQFESISGLHALEKLNFSGTEQVCKRRHFEIIAGLENLRLLDLEAVGPDPGDLALLAKLPRLDLLNVARNHLTDEHIKAVCKIPSLKKLNAKENDALTPACLEYIAGSKSIEQVFISGCPLISKGDAEAAMAKRPGLVVEVEGEGLTNDTAESIKLFSF